MKAFVDHAHWSHCPQGFFHQGQIRPSPERPERAALLLEGTRRAGLEVTAASDHGLAPVQAVHASGYLDFLRSAAARWAALGATSEVLPNVHPNRHMRHTAGEHVVAQAGYYQADGAAPISAGTWTGACSAANVAVSAAAAVMAGEDAAYALARPPGHHAYADMAGGFCFLNNTAIAAQYCRNHGADRVAVVDVDVHHGNGTQGMFYHRSDVLTVSLHGDPASFYPYFAGFAEETGEAEGRGFNLNLPLPRDTGDDAYLRHLDDALERVCRYAPDIVVVALGLDASEQDPLAFTRVTTDGFRQIGARLAALRAPVLLVQEGGYISPILSSNLEAVLHAFQHNRNRP
jgi:acetoin utilization deacetylase AcuC-like enzyme